jgi:hypothetical protein
MATQSQLDKMLAKVAGERSMMLAVLECID